MRSPASMRECTRRAAREGELALAETRPFAGLTEPPTDLDRVVDMC